MEVEKQIVLDIIDTNSPSLSTTTDMPVVETKPDATPMVVPAAEEIPTEPAPVDPPDDPAAPPAKKSQGVQKRIDELTRQREDKRRAREAEEARELRILSALEKATGVTKSTTVETEPVKPQEGSFSSPQAYDEALDKWIEERTAYIADRKVNARF